MAQRPGLRLVSRPLSLLATGGSIAAGVAAFGASWCLEHRAEAERNARRTDLLRESLASTADAVGSLLAAGDLSGARRLVAALGRETHANACRLEIAGGAILADLVPSRITQAALPDPWPSGSVPPEGWSVEQGIVAASVSVPLGNTAHASLVFEAPVVPLAGSGDLLATFTAPALVGLAAACGAFLVAGTARRRMRDLVAVGEAAAAAAAGEPFAEALCIDERLGALAPAWNTLVPRLVGGERPSVGLSAATGDAVAEQDGRGVCDTLWHGILVVDAAGRIRYLNGAAALLLSVRREAALGSEAADLIGHAETMDAVRRAASGDHGVRASFERSAADGSEDGILRFSVRTLRSPAGGSAAFVLVEDVTQQRLADRSRNAFVAQATHELRTPLTNIRLYLEDLLEGGDGDPEARGRSLEVISTESLRLERMVGDMLSIAEIDAGTMRLRPDDVRLEPLIQSLARDFQAMAKEKSITLDFKLPPKYPTLVADRDKVTMTLANLLGNALKYTPKGGTVTVAVRPGGEDIRFDITDSGIGIKEEEHELVFRSFYRSKDRRVEGIGGTGLGLPIARQIARLHGGDILLTSAVDRGSTFTLVLPLRASVAKAA